MASYENSYTYANKVRDVSEVFTTVIKDSPVLSTLIQTSSVPADNTKYEWLEDVVAPKSYELTAAYTLGDGSMTIADTSTLTVGTIIDFEIAGGASSTLHAKVTGITNATDFTISSYGDNSTDQNIAIASTVIVVAVPKNEGTDATANNGREPTTAFNYTQIFDRTAKVSNTSRSVKMYGVDDALDLQVSTQLFDMAFEMVASMIRGQRVERSATEAGTMGGLLYFTQKASDNKIDALAAAVSLDIINDALALANANGGLSTNWIVGHPDQIRKLGAFNQANIQISQADRTRGTYVTQFVGDLGDITTLISDRNFPKDQLLLLDSSKVSMLPLDKRNFEDKDATPNGADYSARRIIGEYTMEFKNPETCTLIENLAI